MGRLSQETTITHFNHPHPLHLSSPTQHLQSSLTPISCVACTNSISSSSWTYSCPPCRYHIHLPCSQLPPLIHHPSHSSHTLTLLPTPAYPEGYFTCDACASNGTGFSYHCSTCNLDLHTTCASMSLSVSHFRHAHPLTLSFFSPYENKGFSCDVCGNMGGNHWLYRCAMCEFDVHLGCAATKADGVASRGQVGRTVSQPAMGSAPAEQTVIGRAFSGIVDGVAQQFGQTIVQGIMGDSDGGGGGGSSILNAASVILGGAIGGLGGGGNSEAASESVDEGGDYRAAVVEALIASHGRRAAIDSI